MIDSRGYGDGVLVCWWGYAWKGHSDNWTLKNLSTRIEASATGESLNSGDPAVHPAARHKAQLRSTSMDVSSHFHLLPCKPLPTFMEVDLLPDVWKKASFPGGISSFHTLLPYISIFRIRRKTAWNPIEVGRTRSRCSWKSKEVWSGFLCGSYKKST